MSRAQQLIEQVMNGVDPVSLLSEAFQQGTVTHLESILKKFFSVWPKVKVEIQFGSKFPSSMRGTMIVVSTPSATWYEDTMKEKIPEFNKLISQFHVSYTLSGNKILIK
jgi:hypothetical protein